MLSSPSASKSANAVGAPGFAICEREWGNAKPDLWRKGEFAEVRLSALRSFLQELNQVLARRIHAIRQILVHHAQPYQLDGGFIRNLLEDFVDHFAAYRFRLLSARVKLQYLFHEDLAVDGIAGMQPSPG